MAYYDAFRCGLEVVDGKDVEVGNAGGAGGPGSRSVSAAGVRQLVLALSLHSAAALRAAGATAVPADRPSGGR